MATDDYWAEAPINRHQAALFTPTLDETISEDDSPTRLPDRLADLEKRREKVREAK